MNTRKITFVTLMTALVLFGVGCNPETVGLNGEIAGIWKFSEGETFGQILIKDLQYIEFKPDGSGTVYYQNEYGITANEKFFYAVINESAVALDFIYSSRSIQPEEADRSIAVYDKTDGPSLSLTDTEGNSITLTQETEVPSGLILEELTADAEYPDLGIELDDSTDLVYDGSYLWFEENDAGIIYPFDPDTEEILTGSAVDLSFTGSYTHIQTFQAGSFWTHCNCGSNEVAERNTPAGTTVDEVDTDTELSSPLSIESVAWDGTHLWLSGHNYDDDIDRLLKADSDAEPDTLVSVYNFPEFDGLTTDGSAFWGILNYFGDILIRFTLEDSEVAVQSVFTLPQGNLNFIGVERVGEDIYLLASERTNGDQAVILKAAL